MWKILYTAGHHIRLIHLQIKLHNFSPKSMDTYLLEFAVNITIGLNIRLGTP